MCDLVTGAPSINQLSCEGNRCRKNVTKFRPFSSSTDSSKTDREATLPVSVIVHNDPAAEYKYLLKSVNDPPQIRVVVPGTRDSWLPVSLILVVRCCSRRVGRKQ